MDLIARSKLPEALELFGLEYGRSGVDAALRATGIKPTRYKGQPGGRGRISLFDPIVAWVLVSVWESNKRRFTGLRNELEYYRELHDELRDCVDAKYIPGFVDDREAGAQLLILTSPVFGMVPRDIRRITFRKPKTLDYSQHGRQFVVAVLQAYNNVYGGFVADLPIAPDIRKLESLDSQRHTFAKRWLREARFWFECDTFNEGAEHIAAEHPEGGEA